MSAVVGRLAPPARSRPTLARVERGLLQAVILLWVYALYNLVRGDVTGTRATALRHATQIQAVERVLHLNIEQSVGRLAGLVPGLVTALSVCYTMAHLVVPPIVLFVLYRRDRVQYRRSRDMFVVLLALALVGFALFPLAPPRVAVPAHPGVVSGVAVDLQHSPIAGLVGSGSGSAAPTWAGRNNPFAAMPSLHVAWALWGAVALWPVTRRRWLRVVLATYVGAMVGAVLVTANHWTLDVLGGFAAVALAAAVVRASRRRVKPAPQTIAVG
jgi:hypothetical protein